MIQNAAARLVFKEPKRAHVTPSLSPCTGYQLQLASSSRHWCLAYRTITGSAPTYFHSLLQTYIPSRSLRSASERRLVVPSQRGSSHSPEHSLSPFLAVEWSSTPIRNAGSLSIFKQQLKTSSLSTLLDYIKKKKKKKNFHFFKIFIFLFIFLSFPC